MSHKYDKEECTVFVDKGLWHHLSKLCECYFIQSNSDASRLQVAFQVEHLLLLLRRGCSTLPQGYRSSKKPATKVVGYYSNTFLKPQLNFMNMEKGAKNGYVHYFRPYLEGRSFKLFFPTIKPWPISLTSQSLDENLRRGQVNSSSSLTISSNYKNLEGD